MLRKIIISSFLLLTVSFGGVSIFPLSAYADHSILHTLMELQESISILQSRVNALASVLFAVKPEDTGKPADVGKPADAGKPKDTGKPAEIPVTPAISPEQSPGSSGGGSNSSTTSGGGGGGGGGTTAQPATPAQPSIPAAPSEPVSGQQQAQAQIQDIKTKIQEVKNKLEEIQTQASAQLPSKALLARTLNRGASGSDVKGAQELLKHFPGIYPNGLSTGLYGPATEKAVKKLQGQLGLSSTGKIDAQTRDKINEIASAVERKLPPKISAIAPSGASVGSTITLGGTGFTLDNNSLFAHGKIILTNLPSRDGTTIEFPLPIEIPCEVGQACPIKIINSNGISNAKPFKLAESVPQPIPEPSPEPTPTPSPTTTPTPTSTPTLTPTTTPTPIPTPTPTPTPISVISPNGGEAYKYGDSVTIIWEAKNIASKSVNIKLIKTGSVVSTIASNVPQSDASGLFLYSWIIPSSLAVGSDYAIEVSDASAPSVKDTSDGQFDVASLTALKLLRPNEGEVAMRGFKIPIIWEYTASVPSTEINVNLYKGGIFQKTISTNLSHQGINGISGEDWQRYFQNHSPYPSFALIDVPDVPEGADYALEIVNSANLSLRDASDAPFSIISLPSPVTFKGRLLDRFTLAPIPNVQLGGYGTYTFMSGNTTSIAHPRTTTNTNGEFSFSTTTDHMLNDVRSQALIGVWPTCYNTGMASLYRDPRYPITTVNIIKDFSLQYLNSSATYKYFPLISQTQDWGDQPLWPMTQIKLYTDIPVKFGLEYQNGFGIFGGGGNSLYKLQHTLSTALPLDVDTRVKLTDQMGTVYSSPFILLPRDYGCAPKTVSFMDGMFKWEPYPIGIGMSWTGGTVGTYTKATLNVSTAAPYGGVAPFTWKMIGGALPPGMIFDPATATVSGVPTLAGTYAFDVRVTDAGGVRASATLSLSIR